MALSDQLEELAHKHGAIAYQSRTGEQRYGFTPAGLLNLMAEVAGEVRKQDTALILQLVEALETVDDAMPFPVARQVLKVARARLEGKP